MDPSKRNECPALKYIIVDIFLNAVLSSLRFIATVIVNALHQLPKRLYPNTKYNLKNLIARY